MKARKALSLLPPLSLAGLLMMMSNDWICDWQRATSQPVSAANFSAAALNVIGGRRVRRWPSSSPISSSIHTASACDRNSASDNVSEISPVTTEASRSPSDLTLIVGSVARSRLSPITPSLVICVPNSRDATMATDAAGSVLASSLTIVADVPMQFGVLSRQSRSRSRRTNRATSAPATLYVWSSSSTMKSRFCALR